MIKDLVSVIIPTYNRAHLIKRSIMSVLNQTYSNLELIIVDDGSTDNTEEVVKSIDDNRVIYIKQSNQGACTARNNGINHAKGEFIAFQDSDDAWHEDKLEKQIKCLKETGADLVVCKVQVTNNDITEIVGKEFHKEGFLAKDELPYLIGTQTFCGKTVIFFDEQFDINMPRYQDFEILLRIHKKYKIYCLNNTLVDYYLQNDSITKKTKSLLKAWKIILSKDNQFMNVYAKYRKKISLDIFNEAIMESDTIVQKELFSLAFKFYYSYINIIKLVLIKLHIYNLIKKIRS